MRGGARGSSGEHLAPPLLYRHERAPERVVPDGVGDAPRGRLVEVRQPETGAKRKARREQQRQQRPEASGEWLGQAAHSCGRHPRPRAREDEFAQREAQGGRRVVVEPVVKQHQLTAAAPARLGSQVDIARVGVPVDEPTPEGEFAEQDVRHQSTSGALVDAGGGERCGVVDAGKAVGPLLRGWGKEALAGVVAVVGGGGLEA